jgi:hypothetical protein
MDAVRSCDLDRIKAELAADDKALHKKEPVSEEPACGKTMKCRWQWHDLPWDLTSPAM